MPAKPPPIPELVYGRVMLVGKVDGYVILLSAGLLALFFAPTGFWIFTVAACLAAGTGAMEVHGSRLLGQGDESGMNWLVRAQLLLMLVALGFVAYYYNNFNEAYFRGLIPEMRKLAAETYPRYGLPDPYEKTSDADILILMRMSINTLLVVLAMVSCVYQGLMARYYHKRRAAVAQAIDRMYEKNDA